MLKYLSSLLLLLLLESAYFRELSNLALFVVFWFSLHTFLLQTILLATYYVSRGTASRTCIRIESILIVLDTSVHINENQEILKAPRGASRDNDEREASHNL